MGYGLTVVTPPAEEPTSAGENKLFCRVSISEDDTAIATLISAARECCERVSGLALVTQTRKLTLDSFVEEITGVTQWDCQLGQLAILFPVGPVQSVTHMKYRNVATGVLTTLDPAAYQVDVSRARARILPAYGESWPTPRLMPAAVEIQFVCGFGAAAAVPSEIKARLWNYVVYCYRNRLEPDALYLESLFGPAFWTGVL